MLPTGDVLIVGGNTTGKQFTSEAAVLGAEVWNPATNTWRTLAAEARPRAYHSAAILLPDGRVLAAGGGLCGRAGCKPGVDETNGEIYSPPYLFNPDGTPAVRPVLATAPEKIGYNETFTVSVEGRSVTKFSLIKLSAITHGINTDLRYLSVPFVKSEAGAYTLTSDENPSVLTPGYYFLFAVDDKGVPSVSKTILVAQAVVTQ
jgi:galactose oxidase